jgi:orotidine-5'-phosphate decarboxylase
MTTIIVALDTPVYREALFLISELNRKALCNWFKVGMECFYSYDGELVMTELENAKCKVFLDLKLNDIPTTVEKATTVLLNRFPFIEMLSVRTPHAVGAALRAASAVGWKGLVVHVPVLSCEAETGVAVPSAAPAIVCRPSMVPQYKHHGHVTVAVGLRLPLDAGVIGYNDAQGLDHAEPGMDANGADYAVIGRPITTASNIVRAFESWNRTCNLNGGR